MSATIFALASGQGRAAVAVLRISGPATRALLEQVAGAIPLPRHAALVTVRHPHTGETMDRGLVLWFPAPRSFSGEDSAELHLHGSRAVVAAVLAALAAWPGCRLAEPGEFTRRAFLNGKMDLAAVEGLADLIEAETEAQRRQALRQLDGALGRWVEALREPLLDALALAESAIDFADEADVSASALEDAAARAAALAAVIQMELARSRAGERIRDGFVVTIAGPPNAGKSTLLNALARREVAIVSPHAGTTRDPITIDLDLGGYAVSLIDTAGLRDSADPVEREGVARARTKAEGADLVLWLEDALAPPVPAAFGTVPMVTVGSKADLPGRRGDGYAWLVSAETGAGLGELTAHLRSRVEEHLGGGETALVTRLRHRRALEIAETALNRVAATREDAELAAEDLRAAAATLGSITGRIDVEDILGAIFERFCIGK